jgi:hypothetical protein
LRKGWSKIIIIIIIIIILKQCYRRKDGGIEVTRRQGRRRKQLLDGPEDNGGDLKLKEKAIDLTVWRTGFGRGYGQTTE